MYILFVVHQFFPDHYTGSERLTLNWCKQLQKLGHRVSVLTYGITDVKQDYKNREKMLIKEYFYENIPVISIRHKHLDDLVSFNIYDDVMTNLFKDILTEDQVDLVHICHPMRLGSIVPAAKGFNIPVVLTLTDFWLMCPIGIAVSQKGLLCNGSKDGQNCLEHCFSGPYWRQIIDKRFIDTQNLISSIDTVVSGTHFLKSMFQANGHRDDIKVIRFGVNQHSVKRNDKFYSENSKIVIGYLSSLNPHKGAYELLKAYMKVKPKNIKLKIFGDPNHDPDYAKALRNIAKGDNIEFCGKYVHEEMSTIFEEIDLIAVPSRWWENSPLVLLSALAHNVPAIVSELGGLTEIITDGLNGFIFTIDENRDNGGKKLDDIIQEISKNPQILNTLKANIKRPPRLEEEVFCYECLYRELIMKNN